MLQTIEKVGLLWLLRLDMTQPEQRQALVDTFINAIYLYDDKVLITFNYKEGTETVAFGEAVKAEKSSDMSSRGAPDIERQIERFGVLSLCRKAAAHRLHICPNQGLFCARLAQPAFLCIKRGSLSNVGIMQKGEQTNGKKRQDFTGVLSLRFIASQELPPDAGQGSQWFARLPAWFSRPR